MAGHRGEDTGLLVNWHKCTIQTVSHRLMRMWQCVHVSMCHCVHLVCVKSDADNWMWLDSPHRSLSISATMSTALERWSVGALICCRMTVQPMLLSICKQSRGELFSAQNQQLVTKKWTFEASVWLSNDTLAAFDGIHLEPNQIWCFSRIMSIWFEFWSNRLLSTAAQPNATSVWCVVSGERWRVLTLL